MLKGINLTLMIGPAVPLPVPAAVLDALTDIQVQVNSGEVTSGFEMKFTLSKNSPLHTLFLLSGQAAIPIMRAVIVVTVNGATEVLMDGVITHQNVSPGGAGNDPVLTVKGKDLTAVMNWIDFSGIPYPAMPNFARVALILAKYAVLGIIPVVIPSVLTEVPIPVDRIPRHKGKDLAYVKQLAEEAGYVFYLDPGPAPGTSRAYWGPLIKVGAPQPALNMDMDHYTNVESLSFNFDNEGRTLPVVFIQNQLTKVPIPIPIPDVSLTNPPLGLVPPLPNDIEPLSGTAKLSPIRAALFGLSNAAKSADAVTADGTLDVLRYGRVLKARQLVGVRGAGVAFDGLYYVNSVTHQIKQSQYKQSFTLARNGLLSTVPTVPA
ncbi:MAG: hypothetical protein U9R25_06685 [Chloroflexota bacterium]|nr:hypothetical protein [Chloroflexota bacterium]